ncbi:MAG: hypothetical protein CMJ87_11125, partial [Planctomycetes bacterium]|nr:hypothetical protein [Planctomycetota bacterium]
MIRQPQVKLTPVLAFLFTLGGLLPAALAAVQTPVEAALEDVNGDGSWAGPRIVSADGRNELVFEGLFQASGAWVESGRDPRMDFGLKRMRPEF